MFFDLGSLFVVTVLISIIAHLIGYFVKSTTESTDWKDSKMHITLFNLTAAAQMSCIFTFEIHSLSLRRFFLFSFYVVSSTAALVIFSSLLCKIINNNKCWTRDILAQCTRCPRSDGLLQSQFGCAAATAVRSPLCPYLFLSSILFFFSLSPSISLLNAQVNRATRQHRQKQRGENKVHSDETTEYGNMRKQ